MLRLLGRWLTRSGPAGYLFVYIEVDGTARELNADERTFLDTKFDGADGDRPYIKTAYEQRTADGRLSGYLYRSKLPAGTPVKSAPLVDPNKRIRYE